MTLDGHRNRVIFALFSPDGRRLVTGGWDPVVRVWDVASGEQTVPPLQTGRRARWIALGDDGRLILVLTIDGRVQLWDAHTGSPAGGDDGGGSEGPPALGGFHDLRVAEIDPNGRFLLLGRDRQYGIFDRTAPLEASGFVNFGGDRDRALGGAFDSTGRRALVYSSDGSVHVVDVAAREILLKRPPNPDHRAPDVAWAGFAADRTEVLVALTDGTVERWGISTGRQLAEFEVNVEPRRVDVNRAGDRLVMGGWDHTFRVWDVAEGKPLTPPARHVRRLEHIAFSPDGESFATASLDGTARVWDTATGQPLTPSLRHPIAIMGVFFRPDGRQVVTSGGAGIVRLWPLAAADERPVSDLMQLARLYSARRIEPGAGSVPLTGPELERLFLDLRADAPQ